MVVNFNPGASKLHVVKTLKEGLKIGLIEAKDFVDNKQFVCSEEEFPSIKTALIDVGAGEFEVLEK